jgi:hypothetical protein
MVSRVRRRQSKFNAEAWMLSSLARPLPNTGVLLPSGRAVLRDASSGNGHGATLPSRLGPFSVAKPSLVTVHAEFRFPPD